MKIKVKRPIAELDGDEMTRVIWATIKERLVLPHLELELEYYDLGIKNRDETDDAVTVEAARAIARLGVGVKCATITPDTERVREYGLKKAWPSPNGTLRAILDGTVFRRPIMTRNIRPAVRSWARPIVIARHAYGDLYKSVDFVLSEPGRGELLFTPASGAATRRVTVHEFEGGGVLMAMHNTDSSIASFAKACIAYALSERIELWFAAKDTISKGYHGRFKEIFAAEVQARRADLEVAGVVYRYLLVDDAIARIMRHEGGVLWACMNYDGDVFSDMVASGFGSLGMMSSVLVSPEGAFEYEAAHGTVRRHYYEYQEGRPTSTNPVASIFAWSGAIRKRGQLDGDDGVARFADSLERSTLDAVESGVVTKDLVGLVEPRPEGYVTMEAFIDAVASRLASYS